MSNKVCLEEGEEIDFDLLNEQNQKNLQSYEVVRAANADIDTAKRPATKAYETFSSLDRRLEIYKEGNEMRIEETPKEKFDRIQREFVELRQDLDAINKKGDKDSEEAEYLPLLLNEIDKLQGELGGITSNSDLRNILDTETLETLNMDQHILALRENLEYKNSEALLERLKDIQRHGDAEANNVTYKIEYDPSSEKVKQELKYAELQRRIGNLEKILGNTKSNDLSESINKLKNTTELLSENSLDSLFGRISYVNQQLDRLGNKKAQVSLEGGKLSKIEASHDSYKQLETTAEGLPDLIGRFESLQVVHEESANIVNKVDKLKENQNAVLRNLGENQELLKKMEETFKTNLEMMNANIKSLQDRVAKLGK